jgi:hypothetical protein
MLDRQSPLCGLITQPARCADCQSAVTLHVYERRDAPVVVRSVPWICPYCRAANHTDITGRLAVVSRGYPDPDPDRPPDPGTFPAARALDRRCPACHENSGRRVEAASKDAWVIYLRCRHCGSIWTESKPSAAGPDG